MLYRHESSVEYCQHPRSLLLQYYPHQSSDLCSQYSSLSKIWLFFSYLAVVSLLVFGIIADLFFLVDEKFYVGNN